MRTYIDAPTRLAEGERLPEAVRKNLTYLYTYLYKLSEQMNLALSSLSAENFSEEGRKALVEARAAESAKEETVRYDALRSMVVKNATYVQKTMDALQATLASDYLARSEFGTYQESVQAQLTATAEGLRQELDYSAQLQVLDDAVRELSVYTTQVSGYIQYGIVEYEDGVPQYGIGIGQNVTVNADGEIAKSDFMSTYTARKLSFRQGETEVAYISDGSMYIGDLTVIGRIVLGNWLMDKSSGLAFKWIGG